VRKSRKVRAPIWLAFVVLAFALDCPSDAASRASAGESDLSALPSADRTMIDSACRYDRLMHGPAVYYNCVRRQLDALLPGRPSRSVAEPAENVSNLRPGVPRAHSQSATVAHQDPPPLQQTKEHSGEFLPRPSTETPEAQAIPSAEGVAGPAENDSPPASNVQRDVTQAIAVTLKEEQTRFCQDSRDPECSTVFLRGIHYRSVTLTPSGQNGLIVEMSAPGYCGSGGCAIYVLKQTGSKYVPVLEEELGGLDGFQVMTSTNNGYYDLIRIGKLTASTYKWTGSLYVASSTADFPLPNVTDEPATSPSHPDATLRSHPGPPHRRTLNCRPQMES
jgi:hypothetical protein